MTRIYWLRTLALGASFWALSAAAHAHFFVQSYSLPVPFELYATGAAAALALSFLAVSVLARSPRIAVTPAAHVVRSDAPGAAGWGRWITVLALFLCILSGPFGTRDAFGNINMTLFWIVLLLAVPYAVALFGDFFSPVNPWGTLVTLCEKASRRSWTGRVRYPEWLGHYPALFFYMVLIVLELFAHLRPFGLSIALACYTVLMIAGAWLFGKRTWIDRAEVFGHLFRLLGLMSVRSAPKVHVGSARRRLPFAGTLGFRCADWGACLFILFMLSSTAFDGIHATIPWADSFWKGIHPHIRWVDNAFGPRGGNQYAVSTQMYQVWQCVSLLISPFLDLAVFVLFVWASRVVTRSKHGIRELTFQFVPALIPIALAYHISHYYTLFLWQAPQLVKMISDPLGLGWNLFGTARLNVQPLAVDVGTIWHTQVFVIVFGHMVSVLLAHYEALRVFRSRSDATLSQLPMLILMVMFTASGLWILSLPLTGS
jgi:hypothetical protein